MIKKYGHSIKNKGELSSGRTPFWRKNRTPMLAADIDDIELATSRDSSSPKNILSILMKSFLSFFLVLTTLAIAVVAILGLTVLPLVQVGGDRWAVKWAAWPQGQAPQEAYLSVSNQQVVSRELSQRFDFLLSSDVTDIRTVVAGPGGEVTTNETNEILWDGDRTGFTTSDPINPTRLGDNYLSLCLVGVCTPGKYQITPVDSVVGEILGRLSVPFAISDKPDMLKTGEWENNIADSSLFAEEIPEESTSTLSE